jgi:phospholipid/cholesterol/gamma-HCH transport system substrate-binding protein
MESQSHSFVAGLFVIVLILAAIAGVLWLGPHQGPKLLPVDLVTRHSVVGLKADAPVRYRGVDIGRVESIAFDPAHLGQIRVRVGVDPAAPLTESTYAKVSYEGITGVAFVQLDDVIGKRSAPLVLSSTKVTQLELQASFLERAEDDARDLVLKVGRVVSRVDELLNEENQRRLMALVDTFEQTLNRYGNLSRDLEPTVKAMPALVQRTQGTVESVTRLADDLDQKLGVLDALATTANELGATTDDLHRNTLPRVNALLDDLGVDARALKRALRQVDTRPQSLIFGPPQLPPGPGEPGFVEANEAAR